MLRSNTDVDPEDEEEDVPQLSLVQEKVLALLHAGKSYCEAASEVGITDRTIRRWRVDCADFESVLRSQRHAIRESAESLVAVAMPQVVRSLLEIATDTKHPQVLRAIKLM